MFKKLYINITRFILNLKLRYKLLLSYLILIIIPLGVFSLFSYNTVYKIIKQNVDFSATQSFNQTSDFISYEINKIIKVSEVIVLDDTIHQILEKNVKTISQPEQYGDMAKLNNYLDSFIDENDIMKVNLFINDELIYTNEDGNLSSISNAKKTLWYSKMLSSSSSILMCPPSYNAKDSRELSVVRKIIKSDNFSEILGFLKVDFLEKNIFDIISNANVVKGSLTYIQNSADIIVSTTDNSLSSKYRLDLSFMNSLIGVNGWFIKSIGDEQVYIKVYQIPNTDWYMNTIIPSKKIFYDINTVRNFMLFLMVVIGTISYIFAVYITYSITKRLNRLVKTMNTLQTGNLENALIKTDNTDEVGELINNYNYMINRISAFIKEQYKIGQELKSAELKALQAQIHPHFLYNSLDMINWMSFEDKTTEIRFLVNALSKFYKLSLNKGRDIVPIKDELSHVLMYIQIQNMRLNNKIDYKTDIDERILEYGILKITFQPIIENSIQHGILESPSKSGSIFINGIIEDNNIVITISDNGIGIPADRISNIISENYQSNMNNGFGIRNIHDRIRLFFGSDYGVTIESEYHKGTTVKIKIPIYVIKE